MAENRTFGWVQEAYTISNLKKIASQQSFLEYPKLVEVLTYSKIT